MLSPKLAGLLETLDKRSVDRFCKFVASPYFTDKKELQLLLPFCLPSSKQINKEDVWQHIFPDRPYEDLAIRRYLSDLIQLFFQFTALEQWQSNNHRVGNELLEAFSEPPYQRWYASLADKQNRRLHEPRPVKADDFYQRFRFYRIGLEQKENTANHKEARQELESADENLELFFAAEKLRLFADSLGYAQFMPEKADIHFPESLQDWLSQKGHHNQPLTKAYLMVVGLYNSDDADQTFHQLKAMMTEDYRFFSLNDQKALFIHLYNYCIVNKINKGDHSYYDELFELFQLGLERGILLDEGKLGESTYRNIITVALRVKAFQWVEVFIRDYTERLPIQQQKNALDYNLAKVYFHQRQFDRVIGQLSLVEYSDMQYALGSRLLLLKTYFEMDELRSLDSLLDAFRIFLRRKSRLSKPVKDQYLHLLRLVKKLAFVQPFEKEKLKQIQVQIEESNSIEKNWLLEKAQEKRS